MLSTQPLLSPSARPGLSTAGSPLPDGGNSAPGASQPFARALDQANTRQREHGQPPASEAAQEAAEEHCANETAPTTAPGAQGNGAAARPNLARKAVARDATAMPKPHVTLPLDAEGGTARAAQATQRAAAGDNAQDAIEQVVLDLAGWAPGMPLARPVVAQSGDAAQTPGGKAVASLSAQDRSSAHETAKPAMPAAAARGLLLAAEAAGMAGARGHAGPPGDARQTPAQTAARPGPGPAQALAAAGATVPDARIAVEALVQGLAPTRPGTVVERAAEATPLVAVAPGAVSFVSAAAREVPAVFQAELSAALGSPEFAPALGSQLSVLVRDGIEHAQLKLNPAEMGPIEVRISLDGDRAQVDFSAAQAATRQILQDAVPVLASALRESGLTLSGGGVFDQARDPRGDARQDGPRGGTTTNAEGGGIAAPGTPLPRMPRARGVLDLYA